MVLGCLLTLLSVFIPSELLLVDETSHEELIHFLQSPLQVVNEVKPALHLTSQQQGIQASLIL